MVGSVVLIFLFASVCGIFAAAQEASKAAKAGPAQVVADRPADPKARARAASAACTGFRVVRK